MMPRQKRPNASAASARPRCASPAQLDRQQVGRGIEPDDELAALPLDSLGEPVAERRRADPAVRPRDPAPSADQG